MLVLELVEIEARDGSALAVVEILEDVGDVRGAVVGAELVGFPLEIARDVGRILAVGPFALLQVADDGVVAHAPADQIDRDVLRAADEEAVVGDQTAQVDVAVEAARARRDVDRLERIALCVVPHVALGVLRDIRVVEIGALHDEVRREEVDVRRRDLRGGDAAVFLPRSGLLQQAVERNDAAVALGIRAAVDPLALDQFADAVVRAGVGHRHDVAVARFGLDAFDGVRRCEVGRRDVVDAVMGAFARMFVVDADPEFVHAARSLVGKLGAGDDLHVGDAPLQRYDGIFALARGIERIVEPLFHARNGAERDDGQSEQTA